MYLIKFINKGALINKILKPIKERQKFFNKIVVSVNIKILQNM